MSVVFVSGDIFTSSCKVLVNPINCVGAMGKGLALEFRKRYPKMYDEYHKYCLLGEFQTGSCYPYYIKGQVRILNFPTKYHWKDPSKIEYIERGLDWFINHYKILNISSIAFPALGCGFGGLSWEQVREIMVKKLDPLPIVCEIYLPA